MSIFPPFLSFFCISLSLQAPLFPIFSAEVILLHHLPVEFSHFPVHSLEILTAAVLHDFFTYSVAIKMSPPHSLCCCAHLTQQPSTHLSTHHKHHPHKMGRPKWVTTQQQQKRGTRKMRVSTQTKMGCASASSWPNVPLPSLPHLAHLVFIIHFSHSLPFHHAFLFLFTCAPFPFTWEGGAIQIVTVFFDSIMII